MACLSNVQNAFDQEADVALREFQQGMTVGKVVLDVGDRAKIAEMLTVAAEVPRDPYFRYAAVAAMVVFIALFIKVFFSPL